MAMRAGINKSQILKFLAVISNMIIAPVILAQDNQPLKDGTYRVSEANHPTSGATITFRKRGSQVMGTFATPYGLMCYQGSLKQNQIIVTNVVKRMEDYDTGAVSFGPIYESDHDRFYPLLFLTPIKPFPDPGALLAMPREIIARDIKLLNECARHFGEPRNKPVKKIDCKLRSIDSKRPAQLVLTNRSHEKVRLYWLDFDGAEKYYGELGPGRSTSFNTFISHPWCVRSAKTGEALESLTVSNEQEVGIIY
jgi:hypothetical protein